VPRGNIDKMLGQWGADWAAMRQKCDFLESAEFYLKMI
jgi:hypothetical protein